MPSAEVGPKYGIWDILDSCGWHRWLHIPDGYNSHPNMCLKVGISLTHFKFNL